MGKPSFDLGENEIELGIGVHGEPGVKRVLMMLADTSSTFCSTRS